MWEICAIVSISSAVRAGTQIFWILNCAHLYFVVQYSAYEAGNQLSLSMCRGNVSCTILQIWLWCSTKLEEYQSMSFLSSTSYFKFKSEIVVKARYCPAILWVFITCFNCNTAQSAFLIFKFTFTLFCYYIGDETWKKKKRLSSIFMTALMTP